MKKKNILYLIISLVLFSCFFFLGMYLPKINFQVSQHGDKYLDNKLSDFIVVNEELNYEVSYSFIKLGTIKVKTLSKIIKGNREVFKAIAYIDSYNVPFVTLHNVFESEIDEDLYSYEFIGSELIDKQWRYTKYSFNYQKNKAFLERGYAAKKTIEWKDTADLKNQKYQDGLSLFFYARGLLFSQNDLNIPCLIVDKCEVTPIKYPCAKEEVEIDAVNYPVDVLKFEGKADWVGIFGLTGKFRGWFSNDAARIPIIARMNVLIGSVYIELKSWNRPGWLPPKKN